MKALSDLTPQDVLYAIVCKDARSYSNLNTQGEKFQTIQDYVFNSTHWYFTPRSSSQAAVTMRQIDAAPKWFMMDAILNACENWEFSEDDRTFMEYVGASMGGIAEEYTIKGYPVK